MNESKSKEALDAGILANFPRMQVLSQPKLSKWNCHLFGMARQGISIRPQEGEEPNWFWRWMQYLAFGNEWIKDR